MFKLVVHICAEEEEPETIEERYFSSAIGEILSRLMWPWLNGDSFAIYKLQADHSWLLYYHSIPGWWKHTALAPEGQ